MRPGPFGKDRVAFLARLGPDGLKRLNEEAFSARPGPRVLLPEPVREAALEALSDASSDTLLEDLGVGALANLEPIHHLTNEDLAALECLRVLEDELEPLWNSLREGVLDFLANAGRFRAERRRKVCPALEELEAHFGDDAPVVQALWPVLPEVLERLRNDDIISPLRGLKVNLPYARPGHEAMDALRDGDARPLRGLRAKHYAEPLEEFLLTRLGSQVDLYEAVEALKAGNPRPFRVLLSLDSENIWKLFADAVCWRDDVPYTLFALRSQGMPALLTALPVADEIVARELRGQPQVDIERAQSKVQEALAREGGRFFSGFRHTDPDAPLSSALENYFTSAVRRIAKDAVGYAGASKRSVRRYLQHGRVADLSAEEVGRAREAGEAGRQHRAPEGYARLSGLAKTLDRPRSTVGKALKKLREVYDDDIQVDATGPLLNETWIRRLVDYLECMPRRRKEDEDTAFET